MTTLRKWWCRHRRNESATPCVELKHFKSNNCDAYEKVWHFATLDIRWRSQGITKVSVDFWGVTIQLVLENRGSWCFHPVGARKLESWWSLQVGACNQRLQPHLSWCSKKKRCKKLELAWNPKKKRFFPLWVSSGKYVSLSIICDCVMNVFSLFPFLLQV